MLLADMQHLADLADQRHGFDPGQMRRLITQESGWDPDAVSPAGARGLTQFMPATGAEWNVDFSSPRSQIEQGGAYLAHLRDYFGGDMRKAIAAYNWGMGNVERKGLENMPQETQNYLQNVYQGPGMPQNGILTDEVYAPEMSPYPVAAQPMPIAGMGMTAPSQPAQPLERDWAGLGYGLAEILATANNEPRMAEVFRQRRMARDAGQHQLSGMQREYLLSKQQGYQGEFLDFVRDRSIASQTRPTGAGGSVDGGKTHRIGNQLVREYDDGRVDVIYEAPQAAGRRMTLSERREARDQDMMSQGMIPVRSSQANRMQDDLNTLQTNRIAIERFAEEFDPDLYNAFSRGGQAFENYGSRLGLSPGELTERKNRLDAMIQEFSSMIVNQRFGSAVTEHEMASARRFLPDPQDSASELQDKFQNLYDLYNQTHEHVFSVLQAGYFSKPEWRQGGLFERAPTDQEPDAMEYEDTPISQNVGADQVALPDAAPPEPAPAPIPETAEGFDAMIQELESERRSSRPRAPIFVY